MGKGFGHDSRVLLDEEISVGIEASAEFQGTKLSSADGQYTDAGTKTLLTAAANKVLLIKRVEFSVDVDQENVNGPFKLQVLDADDNPQVITKPWNPKTSSLYGNNVTPDFLESGSGKSIQLIIPAGFTDKLDWVVHYQELDSDA